MTKKLEVYLNGEEGKNIIPVLSKDIKMTKPLTGAESVAKVALHFRNVEFPRFGSYTIHAILEGNEIASIPLKVNPPPKPLPGSQSPSSN